MPGLGAYCASKAAVNLLTKTAAREHPNLRVNAVSPGEFLLIVYEVQTLSDQRTNRRNGNTYGRSHGGRYGA